MMEGDTEREIDADVDADDEGAELLIDAEMLREADACKVPTERDGDELVDVDGRCDAEEDADGTVESEREAELEKDLPSEMDDERD